MTPRGGNRFVYFIKPIGMDGPIKIGCSAAPEARKGSLETWSPFPLEVIASVPGNELIERRFHARFLHLHERREWFKVGPDLLAVVEAINAGVFDVESLPAPLTVVHRHLPPKSDKTRRQLSYALRITHLERRCGFFCNVQPRDLFRGEPPYDLTDLDAFIANPENHGRPINAPWAARNRAKWLAGRSAP